MTSYDLIYARFFSKIKDYSLSSLIRKDREFAESVLLDFLRSACTKYIYSTRDYSNRDDENLIFNFVLTETEQEVLALLMVSEYLSPKIIRSENIEERLGSKDLRQFSSANLIREIRNIKTAVESEANDLMIFDYYRSGV